MPIRRIVALVALLAHLAACSHTSLIRSDPPGAHLYIDGVYKGLTPYSWETSNGAYPSMTAEIRIEKKGYEPVERAEIRKEWFADETLWWFALLPVFFLGVYGYILEAPHFDDEYFFPLRPEGD